MLSVAVQTHVFVCASGLATKAAEALRAAGFQAEGVVTTWKDLVSVRCTKGEMTKVRAVIAAVAPATPKRSVPTERQAARDAAAERWVDFLLRVR